MVFKIIICVAQERARERETYQFHDCGCGWRGNGLGGGRWISRKRLDGGVTAEIGGERERERHERE
ncbi:hypothetical protein TIFTF001_029261 [Ficus carica]|uniref:Uncharacterized protein n=1 Tax=Ficus carica TaxID=3494 RepID=A0AA88J2L5_FICCA|nr:hypothetical protein TIFTF001_029261 [Ficus carica]